KWATEYNIPQYALNALLNVLKCDGGLTFLPKDSRTLLQCKSTKVTNIQNVKPRGYYYHFGLSATIGVDGLPLSATYIMPHHEHVFLIGNILWTRKTSAFLLKVKNHSGFFSCTRCTVEGDYQQNCVCFPYLPNGSTLRTHDDYVAMKYEECHTYDSTSCISPIPNVDVVQLFSMDYMHMVCLGVMHKPIHIWMGNDIKKNHITKDFSRKPRALVKINRWKATELRQFLLYTGIIVLKNVLSDGCYQNFLVLCISMRNLLNTYHKQYVNFAQKLLDYFVKTFDQLYGSHLISFNKIWPLDNSSTFPFENYMKDLKRMLCKHDKPLQQVVKRYEEQCKNIKNDNPKNKDILNLTAKTPDYTDNFVGRIFSNKYDFFEIPLKSSKIDIFIVENFSQNLKQRTKSDLKNKLFLINFENKQFNIMWTVVSFETDNTVDVVPDFWYKNELCETKAQVTSGLSSNDNDKGVKKYRKMKNILTEKKDELLISQLSNPLELEESKSESTEADDSDQEKDYNNVPEKNIFTKLSWDNENNSINTAMDNELQTKRNITYENSLQSIKRKKNSPCGYYLRP
ncbi:hypothetical protein QTP88_030204, partial [Uroleucon formosanum]